jgi:hypothetical protein
MRCLGMDGTAFHSPFITHMFPVHSLNHENFNLPVVFKFYSKLFRMYHVQLKFMCSAVL